MVPFYIALVIVSPSNDPRVYRKLSSLSFPHPIGTRILVPDCEMAHVKYYHHDFAWYGDNKNGFGEALYSFVSPCKGQGHEDVLSGNYDWSKFFAYNDSGFENRCLCLEEDGWEAVDDEISDYLSSNLCRS